MGRTIKNIGVPDYKSFLLFLVGFLMGFYAPSLLSSIGKAVMTNSTIKEFIKSKAHRIVDAMSVGTNENIISGFFVAGIVAVVGYFVHTVTGILKELSIGVALGMIFRLILVGVLGMNIPYMASASSINQSINQSVNVSNATG